MESAMLDYDWDRVHDQIVGESFGDLTFDQSVALLGVLNEYRIDYSATLRSIIARARGWAAKSKTPLTVQAATALVSRLFDFDAKLLLTTYGRSWRNVRGGSTMAGIKQRLEKHRFVGQLVAFSELP